MSESLTAVGLSWWQALVLGVVQGATEFLPISSSGHLVLVQHLLHLELPGVTFEVIIHLGTLLAVLAVYRHEIYLIAAATLTGMGPALTSTAGRRRFWRDPHSRWFLLLVIGTIPAAVVGLLWRRQVEGLFGSMNAVAMGWLVTGFFLVIAQLAMRRQQFYTQSGSYLASGGRGRRRPIAFHGVAAENMGPLRSLAIGLFQALALAPGISRSGSTVSVALISGVTPEAAARFSFLLAIPAITGAALLDLGSLMGKSGVTWPVGPLLIGFFAAAGSGYVAIRFLLKALAAARLLPFALYCWLLAAVTLLTPLGT